MKLTPEQHAAKVREAKAGHLARAVQALGLDAETVANYSHDWWVALAADGGIRKPSPETVAVALALLAAGGVEEEPQT